MKFFSETADGTTLGAVVDQAQLEPVVVLRDGNPVAIVVSLRGLVLEDRLLADLHRARASKDWIPLDEAMPQTEAEWKRCDADSAGRDVKKKRASVRRSKR